MTDPTDDTPRTRTDVVDRGREVVDCTEEWLDDGTDWIEAADQVIRDLLAEVEALRKQNARLCERIAEAEPAKLDEDASEVPRLRARVAKLEEALRPFAGQAIEHGAAEVPAVWVLDARAALETEEE